MSTSASDILAFFSGLNFKGRLPKPYQLMNPYLSEAWPVVEAFYRKFYSDNNPRVLILGINPGRLGAGLTGIPFTDTVRLSSICQLKWKGATSFEPSSVFVYDVIAAMGGPEVFFGHFFINSVSPLGFLGSSYKNKLVNANYYDHPQLAQAVEPFVIASLKHQLAWPWLKKVVVVLGTGKNDWHLKRWNDQYHLFTVVHTLEHPRYIMQYKQKEKVVYVKKYAELLGSLI